MPRGFQWCEYVDDDGTPWALRVDADQAADPVRGWTPIAEGDLAPFPRGWVPRAVFGADEAGFKRHTRVSTVLADLWTGAATQFDIEGTDEQPHTVTVLGRMAERRR